MATSPGPAALIERVILEHRRAGDGRCECGRQGVRSSTFEVSPESVADQVRHVSEAVAEMLNEWYELYERPFIDRQHFFGHQA